ncbi:MAG: hypothetical protein M1833_002572 [Piccolia ochrophora]|nr:MAG: hypothetical protein M1833_002572 [Piccolia ochrophora]
MESKRKATATPASPDVEDRAPKRRKLPGIDLSNGESPDTTAEYGKIFFEHVREAKDKRGRAVATTFLELPDRELFPDYYDMTPMPLSLEMLEDKLEQGGYPNLTTLESDVKRMIANAKAYNERSSEVFADAERVRKILSEFMRKNNPAYQDPGYAAFPTPLPGEDGGKDVNDSIPTKQDSKPTAPAVTESAEVRARPRRTTSEVQPSQLPATSAPKPTPKVKLTHTAPKPEGPGSEFVGMTFQQAQELIIHEIINLKDAEGQDISEPFLNLPSRSLRDYYSLIKRPVSLKQIQKRVRGVQGRNDPTGVTIYRTWKQFEDEFRMIWKNAREYNEDDSDISALAGQLEDRFNKRIAQAKEALPDSRQSLGDAGAMQRLKLKPPTAKHEESAPKLKLRFGALAPEPSNSSLERGAIAETGSEPSNGQVETMQDGQAAGAGSPGVLAARPSPQGTTNDRSTSIGSPTPPTASVKHEAGPGQSPALGAVRLANTSSERPGSSASRASPSLAPSVMAPPSRPTSGSPHSPQVNGHTLHHQTPSANHASSAQLGSKWRQPGKDVSDALITNLRISSHPGLKVLRPYKLDIPASDKAAQQSFTISLPASHHYLQVLPTIADNVITRQYRIFVTVNTQRLSPLPQMPHQTNPKHPTYEARLVPGINRIEVEILAGPTRGDPKAGAGQIELEKTTVFVNLMKF